MNNIILGYIIVAVILFSGIYVTVKKAIKDGLKEYFEEHGQK